MATPTSNDVPVFTGVTATGNPELDSLLSPNKWGSGVGNGVSLTYSFPDDSSIFAPGYGAIATSSPPTVQLDEGQQNAFRAALAEFEKVANISFSELDDNATEVGEIRIAISYFLSSEPGMVRDGETLGVAFEPSSLPAAGDIWLNPDFYTEEEGSATIIPGRNDGLYTTLLHEIGHALGLSHPFQIDLGVETLDPELDNILYTIMTYTLDPLGLGYVPDREPTTLMLLDIQAIQYLYGANTDYNSGDDTYSYTETGQYLETIWDGGGNDTIEYSAVENGGTINLQEGQWSSLGAPIWFDDGETSVYSDARTVWIAYGTEIENAVGSSYADVIYGNDLNNELSGGLGDDTIEGFDGDDLIYGGSGKNSILGGAGSDTIYGGDDKDIVFGGSGNDYISGGDGGDFLRGEAGNDTIIGGAGNRSFYGDDGDDLLIGGTGSGFNIFFGGSGDDTIRPGPKASQVSGGDGVDTAEYAGARSDYILEFNTGSNVWVLTDSLGTDDLLTQSVEIIKFTGEGEEETVLIGNVPPTGDVLISGVAASGQQLTASNTLADLNGLGDITYVWKVGGTEVASGTDTLLLTDTMIGKTVTVTATYTDGGNIDGETFEESVESDPAGPVEDTNNDPTGQPAITDLSGGVLEGQILFASVGTLADSDGLGTISYSWKAAGSIIGSGPSYQTSQADVGKAITVTASYTDQLGFLEVVESNATPPVINVNNAPTGLVTISGAVEEGKVLGAANTLFDFDGIGPVTYTWKADGEAITAGTIYRLTQDEVGKTITVTASYTDRQGTPESVTSEATAPVANVNDAAMGTVTISGTPEQGQELTASNDLTDADGLGPISYTWRAGDDVVGEETATFTPSQSEVGKTITVTARYTDLQGTEEATESDATDAVANVNDAPMGAVTISGIAEEEQALTASNDLSDADGLGLISYSWQANGEVVGSGDTFAPDQSDVGKTITVTASYTDQQGTAESVESDATEAVANVNDAPMGAVTISGTPEQGQELTASNDLTDADGLGPISYTWRAGDDVVGEDASTFTPGPDEVGETITVTASYTDLQGTEESVESDATAAVANVNDAPMGTVTISGTPEQGQELTASNDLSDADGLGLISYSWKANGEVVGSGDTFTPGQSDVGKTITVTASYTDLQGTEESLESDATAAVANVNDAPMGTVTISGTPEQGQELTASNDLSDADGLGPISYSWKANGEVVGSGDTFTPGQSDVGKTITVTASYTDLQGTAEAVESAATEAVANVNDAPMGTVTISGTPEQGQELTASNDLSDADGLGPISYSWKANGEVVGSGDTFTPGQSDVGKTITVTASYTDLQGTAEAVESAATEAVANVNDAPMGTVTISGTPEQGQELTASNDLSDADGLGPISYSWKANGEVVGSGDTFTPGQSDVGKTITVTASYTDLQGTAEAVESAATEAVANVNDAPIGAVTITGIAEQGQELTASNDLSDADGLGPISYSWKANGEVVGSGDTFTPGQSDVGKTITVTASYTDLQGTAEAVESAATEAVANVNDAPIGAVTITGIAEQGQELTASNDLSDADGLGPISYSWKANGEVVGSGDTFTPGQSDVGKTITVTASYTDQQGTAESVESAATEAVANVNDAPIGAVTITGIAEQGQELTASNDLSDADGLGLISYSWKANGEVVGSGDTFTPGQSDVGKTITVTASYTDQQGTAEAVESAATEAVANVNDAPMGTVTISGTPEQGQELTASNNLTDADGLGLISYSWKANGEVVGSGDTFTPGQSDVGKTITVTASYTDLQGTAEAVESAATEAVANVNDAPIGAVTITGIAEQGQELTASNDLSDADGLGLISYSWKANGEVVGSGDTFTPGQSDVGKTITVTASYTDLQGTEESVESDATDTVANVNDAPIGAVTITGIAEQGRELTASNNLTDADGLGPISYSWQANGEVVSSGDTFTPGQSDVGKTITVTVSYTDLQGTEESVESDATAAVANVNDAPMGTVTISGTPEQGQELTASNDLSDADGLGLSSYSWKANGEVVGSGDTFTPGQSDVGKTIMVAASYTDQQGTEESVESDATDTVANVNDEPTGEVVISGAAAQGQTLTATSTLEDPDGLGDITYRWNSGGTDRGAGMTLLLTQADVGNTITVTASYTDDGGALESVSSEAAGPVENVNDAPVGLVQIAGEAFVGETLSASNTLSDADGLGDISYTWKADDTTVGVGDSYLLTASDVSRSLTVEAAYTDGGGFAELVSSQGTAPVETTEAEPLVNIESFIALRDFIVSAFQIREVIGVLPGTAAGESLIQMFSIQDGTVSADGESKVGRFGEFRLDPDTGAYRYIPNRQAIEAADETASEVFVVSVSDGITTEHRIINVANFDGNEFVIIDPNDDGRLFDAELILESGGTVIAEEVQLFRTYAGAMGRDPDDGGFGWWSDQIAQGNHDLRSMIEGFLWSAEFLGFFDATRPDEISSGDFVLHMYTAGFGRDPDEEGFAFWKGELDSGNRTQVQVILDMTQSNEFVGVTSLAAVDLLFG